MKAAEMFLKTILKDIRHIIVLVWITTLSQKNRVNLLISLMRISHFISYESSSPSVFRMNHNFIPYFNSWHLCIFTQHNLVYNKNLCFTTSVSILSKIIVDLSHFWLSTRVIWNATFCILQDINCYLKIKLCFHIIIANK